VTTWLERAKDELIEWDNEFDHGISTDNAIAMKELVLEMIQTLSEDVKP